MQLKKSKSILLITSILGLLICTLFLVGTLSGTVTLEDTNNSQTSTNSTAIMIGICAIVNLISIILILKDILKHKKKLIILNIIQLLLGSIFNLIFAIINFFVLSKIKNNDEVKEKRELPILEDITKHKWYVYFIIFIFLFAICYTPLIDLLPIVNNRIVSTIIMILLYVIQITLLVIPMANELKRDFSVLQNNFKLYISKILPRFGIVIIAYFICTFAVMLFVGEISENQLLLNSLPIYVSVFLAIVVAPLTEELMFRGFIRKFIKNDILFILVSSIIFGALHVTVASSWQQLLYIIPYSILGLAFSLNYLKTKNIASNILLHGAWNSIAVIAMLLTILL